MVDFDKRLDERGRLEEGSLQAYDVLLPKPVAAEDNVEPIETVADETRVVA